MLFRHGATSTRRTHMQFGTVGQICLELMTPTQNGGRAHAGDLHQQMFPAMAEPHRFQCDELAPLWLIEPAEKNVHVMMKGLIRMRLCGLAKRAFAMMYRRMSHGSPLSETIDMNFIVHQSLPNRYLVF
ncbi:MAG: hypothetical protein JWO49_3068 [Arthrobacter sp.]|nr:hypothetical protein [Arthrobacter sp.]